MGTAIDDRTGNRALDRPSEEAALADEASEEGDEASYQSAVMEAIPCAPSARALAQCSRVIPPSA